MRNIYFKESNQIPELEGTPFSIEDESMSRKCEALYDILRELEKVNPQKLSIILLIPEGIYNIDIFTYHI